VGFAIYAFAPTGVWFLAGIPVVALWGLAGPTAQGLMTRQVGPTVQGELQGAMGSLQGVATIIGPLLFATTFAWSIGDGLAWHMPGAAFLLAGALLAASAWIVARATRSEVTA
jgi:DHA1 family tetracycline resistance protein-like MFS transporter